MTEFIALSDSDDSTEQPINFDNIPQDIDSKSHKDHVLPITVLTIHRDHATNTLQPASRIGNPSNPYDPTETVIAEGLNAAHELIHALRQFADEYTLEYEHPETCKRAFVHKSAYSWNYYNKDKIDEIKIQSTRFICDKLSNVCSALYPIIKAGSRTICLYEEPALVIGSLNGNFCSLMEIERLMFPGCSIFARSDRIIFLGNFSYGHRLSLETLAYLFSLRLLYPEKIILLLGPAEAPGEFVQAEILNQIRTTECHSLQTLLAEGLGADRGTEFYKKQLAPILNSLPLAVLKNKVFCTTSGLPFTTTANPFDSIDLVIANTWPENTEIVCSTPAWNLLFGGPAARSILDRETPIADLCSSAFAKLYTHEQVNDFLEHFGFNYIVRGRSFVPDLKISQMLMSFGNKVVTLDASGNDVKLLQISYDGDDVRVLAANYQ